MKDCKRFDLPLRKYYNPLMAIPAINPESRYTYGDYLSWSEEERWELIDGIPMNMGPAPMRRHQKISLNLTRILSASLPPGGKCELYYAPFDVRLPEKDESDEDVITVVQPDLVIVCDPRKLDDRGCRGAPDAVFEIVSPSSGARDMKIKRDLYERHGVREYWIIQPETRTVMVYILTDSAYPKGEVFAEGEEPPLHILPDIRISIDRLFEE